MPDYLDFQESREYTSDRISVQANFLLLIEACKLEPVTESREAAVFELVHNKHDPGKRILASYYIWNMGVV